MKATRRARCGAIWQAVAAAMLLLACSSSSPSKGSATTDRPVTTNGTSSTSSSSPGQSTAGQRATDPRRVSIRKQVPTPTVRPLAASKAAAAPGPGYLEHEVVISGTARAFQPKGALGSDGRWSVVPRQPAAYTSRMLVRQPADPKRFNGTVVVEWMNVTAGSDIAPDWSFTHTELIRDGYAWVGVSAQKIGVNAAKNGDPARYGSLNHPGDQYSYDIYSQAGQVVGHPGAVDPLAGLSKDRRLIADGESQSAIRMTSYVNAVHPLAEVYDGFLVHSRFAAGSPLGVKGDVPSADPAHLRTDLDVPVLVVSTETDVGFNSSTRSPDSAGYRLWEIAGTAHADSYTIGGVISGTRNGLEIPQLGGCKTAINAAPHYEVVIAAIWSLNRWITQGLAPPKAPRLQLKPGPDGIPVRDRYGNALGGIRLPQLDVPTETLTGGGNGGGAFCSLFGSTTPFTPARLKALYPDHATYVRRFTEATQRLLRQGFILPFDAKAAIRSAQSSTVGA